MIRGLLFAFVSVFLPLNIGAQSCDYEVPSGFHHVVLVVHWLHMYRPPLSEPVPWSDTDDLYVFYGGVARDNSDGHPAGFEWYLDTQLVKYCDYNPVLGRMFTDDFESGGLNKWTSVVGGDTTSHMYIPNSAIER